MDLKFLAMFFIVLDISGLVICRRRQSGAGPYRVVLRRSTNLSEDFTSSGEYWANLQTTPYKQSQPQYVWGESFNAIELNDDVKIEIRLATWAKNKWKKGAFALNFEKGCSDFLRQAKAIMVLLHGEEGSKCPVRPTGLRRIRNQSLNLAFPQFPIFPYGRWLDTIRVIKDSKTVGIIVSEAETVPK